MGYVIAYLLITHEMSGIYTTSLFEYPWQEAIPLHMCDMSALAIAYFLFTRKKIFFNCAFFWSIGGGGMALVTPTVKYGFPHLEYFLFYCAHGLILLAVFYSLIALNMRPFFNDMLMVIAVSIFVMIIIYFINPILGSEANFWYLANKPNSTTVINLFPDPPYHIFGMFLLGLFIIILTYLPFFFMDRIRKT